MSDSPRPPASDRRALPRELACFPAYIQMDEGQRTALIRDVSVRGANLLTRARLEEGQSITLHLYIRDGATTPREAHGKVVRFEVRDADLPMWPFAAGVQFDEELTDCAKEIKALAERQAKAFAGNTK